MKTKSYMDIKAQFKRIEDYALKRGIWVRIVRVKYRYEHNICQYLNYHGMWTFQEDVKKLNTPVSKNIYAK